MRGALAKALFVVNISRIPKSAEHHTPHAHHNSFSLPPLPFDSSVPNFHSTAHEMWHQDTELRRHFHTTFVSRHEATAGSDCVFSFLLFLRRHCNNADVSKHNERDNY